MELSVTIANILTFLIDTAHIKKILLMYTNSCKTCVTRQFYLRAKKVTLLDRSRLRALVLIFAHDLQIQIAQALCKHGCRVISDTANKRLVTIEACYNWPRSPLK